MFRFREAQGDIADPGLTEEFQCVYGLFFNKNLFGRKRGAQKKRPPGNVRGLDRLNDCQGLRIAFNSLAFDLHLCRSYCKSPGFFRLKGIGVINP